MVKKLSRTKVLVTGAGGFIGSHLCELCVSRGAAVRAFVRYNSRNDWGMLEELGARKLKNIELLAGDLRDPEAVRRAARGCDVVFHLGALIGIPYSFVHPGDVVRTNVLGTLNVLEACLATGVRRVIQASTSEVYGSAQTVPMDEMHPLNPQSPYAASKVASDKLAESFHLSFGLPVTVIRPFNTYGPRQSLRAIIPTIITQALKSHIVQLGSSTPSRDLTYVADTARGFIAAAEAEGVEGKTIQLGSERETTVAELVNMIGAILGKRLRIVSRSQRKRPKASEVERLFSSNARARKFLGWKPKVSLEQGLAQTVRWFQSTDRPFKPDWYHI